MIEACRKLEEDCLLVGTEGALDFIEAGGPTPRPPTEDEQR